MKCAQNVSEDPEYPEISEDEDKEDLETSWVECEFANDGFILRALE